MSPSSLATFLPSVGPAGTAFSTPAFEFAEAMDFPALVNNPLRVKLFNESWCLRNCHGPDLAVEPRVGPDTLLVLHPATSTEYCFSCGYSALARWAKDVGASALAVKVIGEAGHDSRTAYDVADWARARAGAAVPAVEVTESVTRAMFQALSQNASAEILVNLHKSANPWVPLWDAGWLTMSIIVAVFASLNILLALNKLVRFTVQKRINPALIMAFLLLSNVFVLAGHVSGPFFSRVQVNWVVNRLFITVDIPLSFCATVLIFLVWMDLISASEAFHKQKHWFLNPTLRVVFAVVTSTFVSVDLALTLSTTATGTVFAFAATFTSLSFAFAGCLIGIIFVMLGGKVIRKLGSKGEDSSSAELNNNSRVLVAARHCLWDLVEICLPSQHATHSDTTSSSDTGTGTAATTSNALSKNTAAKKALRRMTTHVRRSALCLFAAMAGLMAMSPDSSVYFPVPRFLCWFTFRCFFLGESYHQIAAFSTPKIPALRRMDDLLHRLVPKRFRGRHHANKASTTAPMHPNNNKDTVGGDDSALSTTQPAAAPPAPPPLGLGGGVVSPMASSSVGGVEASG